MTAWKATAISLALFAWYMAGAGDVLTSGDDFAYASSAVDLARGVSLVHHFDSAALASLYVPVIGRLGDYAIKFPIGVGLLLVPLWELGGFSALFVLSPLMAVLGVLALYGLSMQVTEQRPVSLLAAAILATLPPVIYSAAGIGSDLPSLALVTTALWVYARDLEEPRPWRFSVVCALSGAGFLVRYPNALVLVVIGVHQLSVHRHDARAQLPRWLLGALTALGFVAVQLAVNFMVFGRVVGGYEGEIGADGGFSSAYVSHHLPRYLLIVSAVPPLGLPALAWVAWRYRRQRQGLHVLMAALVLAFMLTCSAWWAQAFDWPRAFVGGARFVLPVVPILCLGLAIAVRDILGTSRLAHGLIALGLLAQLCAGAFLTVQLRAYKTRMTTHRDRIYTATSDDALMIGPGGWAKLFFPEDGSHAGRRYASGDVAGRQPDALHELVRLVDDALESGRGVFMLSSDQPTEAERAAFEWFAARYSLLTTLEESQPYVLRVHQMRVRRERLEDRSSRAGQAVNPDRS